MRTVRFRDPAGNVRRGEWSGSPEEVITVREPYGGRLALGNETFSPDVIEVLPPCDPSKIVCVESNYENDDTGQDGPISHPSLFLKPPSTIVAHDEIVTLPDGKNRVDHAAAFGVVISERCKDVKAKNAMDVIAGYTCLDDISNRDDSAVQNWVRAKAFDGAAPIGPLISRPENVPDDASIRLRVNGKLKQDSSIDRLIVSVPELIEEITSFMTLRSGDVVSTGTPAGAGPLHDGDRVEIEIEGIGTLAHSVRLS